MRDQMNNVNPIQVLAPVAARTDNTALVGNIVDRRSFDALTYLINVGTNTDADVTFTVLLEDGDVADMSDGAAVADAQLLGTEALAAFAFGDDNEMRKLGYIGSKRYSRLTITPVGNDSGNIFISAVAVLGYPHVAPTANPPA
jgi:hypothetical protein